MTDKQIIIDGVDVADCEHINACDKKMKCVILQDDVCETNPYCEGFNCYFKQLKRKEQECEELKNFHINLVGVKECEIRELAELKSENKHLNDLLNQALKELEQSREAIEKIKEIAKFYKKEGRYTTGVVMDKILQICDEVNDVK